MIDMKDLTQQINLLASDLMQLRLEVEGQRWWRWGVSIALIILLWRS